MKSKITPTKEKIPFPHGSRAFQIDFDFTEHQLRVSTSSGKAARLALEPRTVASFYTELMATLDELSVAVEIDPLPTEIPNPIPLSEDTDHASYDGEYVRRWWQVLVQSQRVLHAFRARFIGKTSPIHLFWGALDLAVTRFSGRTAPTHPGGTPHLADWVTREAYSHEVPSAGFWPGNADAPNPLFYSYAYPTPAGFKDAKVEPEGAFWYDDLGEFVLPYDVVRQADDPSSRTPTRPLYLMFHRIPESPNLRIPRCNASRPGCVSRTLKLGVTQVSLAPRSALGGRQRSCRLLTPFGPA